MHAKELAGEQNPDQVPPAADGRRRRGARHRGRRRHHPADRRFAEWACAPAVRLIISARHDQRPQQGRPRTARFYSEVKRCGYRAPRRGRHATWLSRRGAGAVHRGGADARGEPAAARASKPSAPRSSNRSGTAAARRPPPWRREAAPQRRKPRRAPRHPRRFDGCALKNGADFAGWCCRRRRRARGDAGRRGARAPRRTARACLRRQDPASCSTGCWLRSGSNRGKVYIANIVPWRPPGNRTPTPVEDARSACRSSSAEIELLRSRASSSRSAQPSDRRAARHPGHHEEPRAVVLASDRHTGDPRACRCCIRPIS